MALGETFDLGRIIATAEQIKGAQRDAEQDKLKTAYFQQNMANAASEEQRKAAAFSQDQKLFNTRLLNVAAKSVAADPTTAERWRPQLVEAGVLNPDFDLAQLNPADLQQAAGRLASQTDIELQAFMQANPQMAEIGARHEATLREIEARVKGERELATVNDRFTRGQIAARGAEDRATASVQAPGKQRKEAMALRKEFEGLDSVANYQTAFPQLERAKTAPNTRAGDLSIVYALGKIFDPTSVVRGEELKLSKDAQPWLSQMVNEAQSQVFRTGSLDPRTRAEIVAAMEGQVQALEGMYRREVDRYSKYADAAGLAAEDVVGQPLRPSAPAAGGALGVGQSAKIGNATVTRKQ